MPNHSSMKVAFVGCGHGNLDLIYNSLDRSVDLLIICGDFEACRNELDLSCLAGPSKYHILKDYWKYYKGTKKAPILTLFVGGNHEASNHLWELYYGGWAAPNIYFMGYSGVVKVGDLRIAGISGIFDHKDYKGKGHFERVPFNESTLRSAYHTRECEVWKMKHITGEVDIFASHDWPRDVVQHGDLDSLYRKRGDLRGQVENHTFGSPAHLELIHLLKPHFWASGHMHIKYEASYPHPDQSITKFIAMHKSIPSIPVHEFLHIVDFPDKKMGPLCYDEEWLSILRATHQPSFFKQLAKIPYEMAHNDVKQHQIAVRERFAKREEGYQILPSYFDQSAPTSPLKDFSYVLPTEFTQNRQTVDFILALNLPFPGFYQEEEGAPEKKPQEAEFVGVECGVCGKEWKLPKQAALYMESKKQPLPSSCKECSRKKNVKMGWR